MFGCGNYPAFPEIRKSIEAECVDQVKRLRHHPSIVIYAGNNEDYQVQESYSLTYDFEDKDPENWLKTNFPARYIYEKVCDPTYHAMHVIVTDCLLDPSRCGLCTCATCAISPRVSVG